MSEHKSAQFLLQFEASSQSLSIPKKLSKAVIGSRHLFNIHSMSNLIEHKDQYKAYKTEIESCEKDFQHASLASLALGGALAMSIRRYFPNFYSTVTLNKIALDLAIMSVGLIFGVTYGSNSVSQRLYSIENKLITYKNDRMIKFMRNFSQQYDISQKQQIKFIAEKKEDEEKLTKSIQEFYEDQQRRAQQRKMPK